MILFFFNCKTAYDVRISDWSSYVCSSDLVGRRLAGARRLLELHQPGLAGRLGHRFHRDAAGLGELGEDVLVEGALEIAAVDADLQRAVLSPPNVVRKSVVYGKSGSVRVDLGGGRIIITKKQID